jgi:shikimate dehydrogenase
VIPVSGTTRVFPVIGWPVEQVKAPAIYNAYFAKHDIDAVCVPMRVAPEHYAGFVKSMMSAPNVGGICVAIPHKAATITVGDIATHAALAAGAANAIFRDKDGRIIADLIDGEGFVRALDVTAAPEGFDYPQCAALIVGCGGVGSAIAASLADRGIARLGLVDIDPTVVSGLAERLRKHYPATIVMTMSAGSVDETDYDLLVNGTPLGMNHGDPMPFSLESAKASAVIADCGMKTENTELLRVAAERGHRIQKGKEMLFEQAPLYMERFGWPGVTADDFRALGVL